MSAPGPAEHETRDILALYETYAARLYAVALRIAGDERLAADILADVFVAIASRRTSLAADPGGEEVSLLRLTRDCALARRTSEPRPPAGPPTDRSLVEQAFFDGRTVADLARIYSMSENDIRDRLRNGMKAMRDSKSRKRT